MRAKSAYDVADRKVSAMYPRTDITWIWSDETEEASVGWDMQWKIAEPSESGEVHLQMRFTVSGWTESIPAREELSQIVARYAAFSGHVDFLTMTSADVLTLGGVSSQDFPLLVVSGEGEGKSKRVSKSYEAEVCVHIDQLCEMSSFKIGDGTHVFFSVPCQGMASFQLRLSCQRYSVPTFLDQALGESLDAQSLVNPSKTQKPIGIEPVLLATHILVDVTTDRVSIGREFQPVVRLLISRMGVSVQGEYQFSARPELADGQTIVHVTTVVRGIHSDGRITRIGHNLRKVLPEKWAQPIGARLFVEENGFMIQREALSDVIALECTWTCSGLCYTEILPLLVTVGGE